MTRKKSDDISHMLTLTEMCALLSVSTATGRNWLRLGTLQAQTGTPDHPLFLPEYAEQMKEKLRSDSNSRLKSRRNKQMQSGFTFFRSYTSEDSAAAQCVREILAVLNERSIRPDEEMIRMIEAEYALRLLEDAAQRLHPEESSYLLAWREGRICPGTCEELIEDILYEDETEKRSERFREIIKNLPELFNIPCVWEPEEDLLGLLLISLRNLGKRKAEGAYYTPISVVRTLCRETFEEQPAGTIWDPACGTGNFLLHLPGNVTLDQIYGSDIDLLTVQLARVNLALRYHESDVRKLYRHLICMDTLNSAMGEETGLPDGCDYIIGNPPWGVRYTETQRKALREKYRSAHGWGTESCDLFIEESLKHLKEGGRIAFVLPEAVLHVKSHEEIRSILNENCRFSYLNYLGDVFDGVQCPSIVLKAEKEERNETEQGVPLIRCAGMRVDKGDMQYQICSDRKADPLGYSFHVNDADQRILDYMQERTDVTYLRGQADFALGIVTGDNSRWISEQKTEDSEIVLRGTDIDRYHYRTPDRYIRFCPEQFQQTAPEALYRAPEKLFYRFICNQLVFAWDNRQKLSLNSCNILIPRIPGMDMRYIMAVLNSRPAQFYYRNRFRSVKVLRSYLEAIPIPVIPPERQAEILDLTEKIMHRAEIQAGTDTCSTEHVRKEAGLSQEKMYNHIDRLIAENYGLTEEEYRRILGFTGTSKLIL